ncbi:MAG: L-threonylcarbamoyladenylate synthase [Spirochaetaceae bacterium]|jgi:tRNA threonylcarbamoyl adenosine modification protein (Sua5/YciO/YrdC/YwlC family)|nr:L-threonylcarbamoyladenylate synthase [Spirochaetaceae bacterium]
MDGIDMIEYIVAENIDRRILTRTAGMLCDGKIAALPTDTSWVVVCSHRSKEGIKRLRSISGERDERHFTLLCSDISQFCEFCRLDNSRFRLLKRLSPGPYVFILNTLLGTEKKLGLRRGELGVRISAHPVPRALIESLGCPLYSITAKKTMFSPGGKKAPGDGETLSIDEEELFEQGCELEDIAGIDLILDSGEDLPRTLSTILDMTGSEIRVIREGSGAWPV